MVTLRSVLVVMLAALLLGSAARAQELDLVGKVSWEYVGSRIDLSAQRIENNRAGGRSGNLRLRLWATTEPYEGGDIEGYPVATFNLGALPAGYSMNNRHRIVPTRSLPAGVYYTTVTLEERVAGGGYSIVDSEGFANPVNFGAYGYGLAEGLESNHGVSWAGDVSWESMDGRVLFSAGQIRNDRAEGRSGTLRLRLWATDTRYDGENELAGFVTASQLVGRLYAGYGFENFVRRTYFRRPPEGNYFITMTLEELTFDGWSIADFVTYDGTYLY